MKHYTISVPEKESSFILKVLSAFNFVKVTAVNEEDIPEEEKEFVRNVLYNTKEEDYITLEETKKELEKVIKKK